MSKLARNLGVHIAWGLVEVDVGNGDLYNAQALVTPTGEMYSYRKINRWGQDHCWAKPGRANPPVATLDLGGVEKKVGLLICRDIRDRVNDKWTSLYERGDADIVAFSANFGDGGFPATAWMDFVESNRCTLVVSNRYGREANNNFGEGGVCIIQPPDKVHCEGLLWNQDCIVYAEV
jgi:predicted amidohydrolase